MEESNINQLNETLKKEIYIIKKLKVAKLNIMN